MRNLVDDEKEIKALLPFYANGSLNAVDTEKVAAWLEAHADDSELHAELRWLKMTQHQLKTAPAAPINQQAMADRLFAKIAADTQAAEHMQNTRQMLNRSHGEKTSWLANLFSLPMKTGFAYALLAIVGVQMLIIGASFSRKPSQLSALSGAAVTPTAADSMMFQVSFATGVTEQRMRTQLNAVHANMVSGPSALGIYIIAISPKDAKGHSIEQMAATLMGQNIYESVSPL